MNTVDYTIQVQPEWTMAIHDCVRILMNREYLHDPNDVEFIRKPYKSVFPCGRGEPIKLNQLMWAAKQGKFWFLWYKGSYLKLCINKGTVNHELKLDPTKDNVWEFVRMVDSKYK